VYEVPFTFYRRRLRYGRFIVGLNARIGNEASLIQLIGLEQTRHFCKMKSDGVMPETASQRC
jgi:hypothetical protein